MKPIVIRFSFGEIHLLWQTLQVAVKTRSWDVVRKSVWLMREHWRRGTWKPWTVGDTIVLRRKKRWMSKWPRQGPRPGAWRHR